MKPIIIFALVSFAAVEVFGFSLYGEKEDVIQEVSSKFSEVFSYLESTDKHIDNEKQKREDKAMEDSLAEGENRKTITEGELQKEVVAATRTAIAKGKPLAAIDCIGNVVKEGKKLLPETLEIHKKAVTEVLPNKAQKLEFLKLETGLIKDGLEGLKKEFDERIKEAKTGFQGLKSDALKKAATAKNQLLEIQKRIDKPSLFDEYILTKSKMEDKFREVKQNLTRRLQMCVA